IVEDRVDRINPESPSTANGPVIPRLFSDAVLAGSPFNVGVDNSLGHGKPLHFDGTTPAPVFPTPVRFPEGTVAVGGDAADAITITSPPAPNLNSLNFSLNDDPEIGGQAGFFGGAPNTSTTIPHVSISGGLTGADSADFYQFSVATTSRVILDIDNGYDVTAEFDIDNDPTTPPVNIDPNSIDLELVLLQVDPTVPSGLIIVDPPGRVDDIFNAADGRAGSNSVLDPFIDTTLTPGVYFVGVLELNTTLTFSGTGNNTGVTAAGATDSGTYTLHVSLEDQMVPPGTGGAFQGAGVIEFDRTANDASGSVTSEPFDLAGYVPADLPMLYFNREYLPSLGDSATLTISSDQNPGGSLVHSFTPGGWD
ncbi:MAG: pre-peptidase C-terminal domain-containing protein, partial [Pirellulales bacterium]|nr:pre-peptidase C-terminal domain-containing protein [Pirellulales bacterium]